MPSLGRQRYALIAERMKMMNRPVAMADLELVRHGDGGADIDLGIANRCFEALPLRKSCRDGR